MADDENVIHIDPAAARQAREQSRNFTIPSGTPVELLVESRCRVTIKVEGGIEVHIDNLDTGVAIRLVRSPGAGTIAISDVPDVR